ncbi:class I SAM-dependent RNA methyltransferase [Terriglobus aquaticus]|uniref:Class I SAM-dependent RNA methyltransferase n=1 Tax=Terriglobus aquaticus TaxID=940139 RepID=A0ABW9KLN2_9BACT|nr:23S rRNA (uracil(1939)-C(5))-methyltransferase RlmD [Terriglobus aquaticus]
MPEAAGLNATAEVTPRCHHFGVCGGCQLQHLSQQTQTLRKVDAVRIRLQQAGVPSPTIETHTAAGYEYRNRIRLRVEGGRVGYSRFNSHDFLPIQECPIASPLLWQAAAALDNLAATTNLWPVGSKELELMTDGDEAALQLLLHVDATVVTLDRDTPRQFRDLCEGLRQRVPQTAGGGLLVQGELASGSRRVQERQRVEVARWGAPGLTFRVNGQAYAVSRGAFFQVNRFLTGRMVELVLNGRSGRAAWDLFAGAGLFSVPLTDRFDQVTAVEVGQPAATDLAAALRSAGQQHRAMAQPVLDFLKRARLATPPDLIVMDPPRAGLGGAITQELIRIGAPEMVYVSCDAATFARDARALVDSRYTITDLHLLDLFPQTNHTETIAVFRRG